MSGNLQGFDANQYEPQSFDVLPAGEYDVMIVASSVQEAKNGVGRYLKLELQVCSGQFRNRKLFDILNLWNPSTQAQTIARGQMSAICRAVGIMTPKDSSELHMKPLRVKVRIDKSEEYGDSNRVVAYKPRQAGPAPQRQQQQTGGNGAPWPQHAVDPGPSEAYAETARQAESVF